MTFCGCSFAVSELMSDYRRGCRPKNSLHFPKISCWAYLISDESFDESFDRSMSHVSLQYWAKILLESLTDLSVGAVCANPSSYRRNFALIIRTLGGLKQLAFILTPMFLLISGGGCSVWHKT